MNELNDPRNYGEHSSPEWEILLKALRAHPQGGKIFRGVQARGHGLYGIIIAGWDESGKMVSFYESAHEGFVRFDDETTAQCPRIYITLKGIEHALQKIEAGRRDDDRLYETPPHIGLAFWAHPEAHFQQIPEFLDLKHRFPGSPRH